MRHRLFVLLFTGSLATLPFTSASAVASPTMKPAAATKPTKTHATHATHATTGVVKSITGSTLVLTPTDHLGRELTFTVAPSAHRDAGIVVGSDVSVRYRTEGPVNTATAITARHHAAKK